MAGKGKKMGRPSDGIDRTQVTVYLPTKVKKLIDAYCHHHGQSISGMVTEVLINFLSRQDIKPIPKKRLSVADKVDKLPDV